MPRTNSNQESFQNEDLVLKVSPAVDRRRWDEDRYEAFLDELCGSREFQKKAIQTALRYLLGQEYSDLKELAHSNFEQNEMLPKRYGSWANMERNLQLPKQLSASLDLATGTGKSYVMYGIAAIMLAEGAVDRVLILCPSTTIETGLVEKFKNLAAQADLRNLLPADVKLKSPKIIDARESITSGSICIENYHAILEHVRSSIRESLEGKGERTLILNDEAHHVANESTAKVGKWKEFLTDKKFNFKYIIGVSGTCYISNEYFTDVIFRYSLRQAMDEGFVKKVHYVAEMPTTSSPDVKWQLVLNRHNEIGKKLKVRKIRPLTIVVTQTIERCKDVAEELKAFLMDQSGKTREQIDEQVLVVYNNAPDVLRLSSVDSNKSKVEWILSVSMLNEGWDVKRVFQIVPHEERAFNSKLLIAQVLGRGLRKPEGWQGEQPQITVFNHDAWASRIKKLVDEITESEKRIPTFPIKNSSLNFELLNIEYDPKPYTTTYPMERPYRIFTKGYIDLATEKPVEDVSIEFVDAGSGLRTNWKTKIKHKTHSVKEVVEVMHQRLEDADHLINPNSKDSEHYTSQFPRSKLEEIIKESLKMAGVKDITDGIRQKFLQSLGTLQRKEAQVVRYKFEVQKYFPVATQDRSDESVSAADLRSSNKTLFFTAKTVETLPDESKEFYGEATEPGSGFKCYPISNYHDFRSPLNAVIADHENERRFIKELINTENTPHIVSWIKSTSMGFYEIDYAWKKGEHPKRGKFNPDFFVLTKKLVLVAEIKDDLELNDPSEENRKKSEYAQQHFERINAFLAKKKASVRYKFNFLTPSDFGGYFQSIRDDSVQNFRSKLDVKLAE